MTKISWNHYLKTASTESSITPNINYIFRFFIIERWAFDVELLKIGEMCGIPLNEVAVEWTEIDGSKLNPILASIQMFKDLFFLWLRYAVGAWRIVEKQD